MIEPAWLVTQAAPFVCGDHGSVRDLEHFLWGMRLSVVLQLVHWKLRAGGVWTVMPPESAAQKAERIFQHLSHGQTEFQA